MTVDDFHHTLKPGLGGTHTTSFTIASAFNDRLAAILAVSSSTSALGIHGIFAVFLLRFRKSGRTLGDSADSIVKPLNIANKLHICQILTKHSGNAKSVVVTYSIGSANKNTKHVPANISQTRRFHANKWNRLLFFSCLLCTGHFLPFDNFQNPADALMRLAMTRHVATTRTKNKTPCLTLLVWRLHWNSPAPTAAPQPRKAAFWRASQGKGWTELQSVAWKH